ncbi:MAG: hypothetical protein WDW38_000303 [Sanguina aurantia]
MGRFDLLGESEEDGWQDVATKKKGGKNPEQSSRASEQGTPPPSARVQPRAASSQAHESSAAAKPSSAAASVRPAAASTSSTSSTGYANPHGQGGGGNSRAAATGQRAHDYYKAFQAVFRSPKTGETILRFHQTEIVRIRPDGGVILNSGGFRTMTTLLSMNDALGLINMKVIAQGGADSSNWVIKDESGSYMYADNCLVDAKSPADARRAEKVLSHYQKGGSGASANSNGGGSGGVGTPRTPPQTQPVVRTPAYSPGLSLALSPQACPQLRLAAPPVLSYQEQYAQQAAAAAEAAGGGAAPGPAASGSSLAALLRSRHQPPPPSHTDHPNALSNSGGVDAITKGLGGVSFANSAANRHEEEGLDEESACIVCMARRSTVLLLPCGHSNMCEECWVVVERICNECPTCRQPVTCSIPMEVS